jgi:hypothetical protein
VLRLQSFLLGLALCAVAIGRGQAGSARVSGHALWPISIDYPEDGSVFPPGITPPTFWWRDAAGSSWTIDVAFAGKGAPMHLVAGGERLRVGPIDPECVGNKDDLPQLTSRQAATRTWTPDRATWAAIEARSVGKAATITITGYGAAGWSTGSPIGRTGRVAVSRATVTMMTSMDEVGAAIFYRDVPLMPTTNTTGNVQPLAGGSLHLIRWRLRDIRDGESRTVLANMPTCGNCHSFSADGKTLGMDIDGPENDKGLYAVVPVEKRMTIESKDLVHWNTDGRVGQTRVGFMSQVSPAGRYLLSTFAGPEYRLLDTFYVTNFMDYRFLQVFYPTRGILEWYDRETRLRQSLPGADDARFVQTDGVWSRDGKWIVFARAEARAPRVRGQGPAMRANDANETQIQYDLYRIPFNEGKGGRAERIEGASGNGMSNTFPRISPDGKWVVFVECGNGQLMRPDSQLYIVPFAGGEARRMRANTSRMNSWHSFSPNGRWMVFASKARSAYTQMYLTHIDAEGNDSPAIIIDNATAANRAVNLPEFVNIGVDGIEYIEVHVADAPKAAGQAGR